MASITDSDKIKHNITRPYNVARGALLPSNSLRCHVSSSVPKLKDSFRVHSSASTMPKQIAELSSLSRIAHSESLSNALRCSAQASQRLGKWITENKEFFVTPPMTVNPERKSPAFQRADIKFYSPTSETNKRLDRLNDNSEKTTELLQLMVETLNATNATNLQVAAMLQGLSDKQDVSNELAKSHHADNSKSAEASTEIARASLKSSSVAAKAAVATIIVTIVLWIIDHFDLVVKLTEILLGLLLPGTE